MDQRQAQEAAAALKFMGLFTEVLAMVAVTLAKDAGGMPPHVSSLVRARLPELSEAAIAVPERVSALRVFDQFVALFPPQSE